MTGAIELLVILAVFLILGPRRIVDILRSAGRGVHDFVETLGRDKGRKELPEEEQDDDRKSF